MTAEIAVAAPVLARSAEEADLIFDSLSRLSKHRYPMTLADGGSGEKFLERLRTLPGVDVRPTEDQPGGRLVAQVKTALNQARTHGTRFVLYTEPDKGSFFQDRLAGFLTRAEPHSDAGIIVPARDAGSFATFPAGQRRTESLTNQLLSETFGQDGDFLYGLLLIDVQLLPYLEQINEEIGWGWRIFLLALAHRLCLPIICIAADLYCPEEQRNEDDSQSRIYRLEQCAQNVRGLALGLKCRLETGTA